MGLVLKKRCICNDMSIKPPTFFITFISAKSKWFFLLQSLHDFNNKKLRFDVPFDKLEIKHIAEG
jgi:hypothetical protein